MKKTIVLLQWIKEIKAKEGKFVKVIVLVENQAPEGLECEHGLSIYVEYGNEKYLLDTGSSDMFLRNAQKLGVSIKDVDASILSHAHYDHAGGFSAFAQQNEKAPIWIRHGAEENCYRKTLEGEKYIGIPKGMLKDLEERILYAKGDCCISSGVYLIPHKGSGAEMRGKQAKMFIRKTLKDKIEDKIENFSHEQTLVFRCKSGLVLLNSCSHGGIVQIVREVKDTFPEEKILAVFGGFHLMKGNLEEMNETIEEVEAIGASLLEEGILYVYTGHCTGTKAFSVLKTVLGEKLEYMKTGMQVELM